MLDKQLLSIVPAQDMDMTNKATGHYELFYKKGIPSPKLIELEGLQVPVLPAEWVVKLKRAFAYPSEISIKDIKAIQKLLKA